MMEEREIVPSFFSFQNNTILWIYQLVDIKNIIIGMFKKMFLYTSSKRKKIDVLFIGKEALLLVFNISHISYPSFF